MEMGYGDNLLVMKQSKDEGSVFDKLVYFFPLNTTKVHAVS